MATQRSTLIAEPRANGVGPTAGGVRVLGGWALLPVVGVAVVVLFALAPWPLEHKAHAALHGLCAQIPSHTFRFGGRGLPFDARMTGIYGGFLTTGFYLVARGRLRAFRMPPRRVGVLLGLFVLAMAIDGSNSFLLDLRLPHAYPPDNRLRLATGLLTGVALATGLAFVLATTLWRDGRWDQASIGGVGELGVVALLQVPFALAVVSGFGPLYVPATLFLLAAATVVVSALMLVVVVLLRHGDRSYTAPRQVQAPAAVALVLGVTVMAAFSAGRFLLERWAGPPPLT